MLKFRVGSVSLFGLAAIAGLVFSSFGQSAPDFRKGSMNITVTLNGAPLPDMPVNVKQIRHHFGFGGAMAYWPLDSSMILKRYNQKHPDDTLESYTAYIARFGDVASKYEETFAKYFEWITPENEMKWTDVQYIRDADNYYKGDTLVAIADRNDMKIRGHNLFWNEHMGWIPDWADSIAYTAWSGDASYFDTGLAIIDQRTDECLDHYKGKCAHWDIINEIVHGQVDTIFDAKLGGKYGTLKALTKMEDAAIFEHILKRAVTVDNTPLYCLNDYNMVSRWSRNDKIPDSYSTVVNGLIGKGCKIDIIGCEGHFGTLFNDNQFTAATLKSNLDYVASLVPTGEIWITECDFEANNEAQAAEWIGTLMDVCFSHPRVGGIVLWTPYQGNRWREQLTSYVVDTSLAEVPMGAKWREKIAAWTTNETKTTGADGKIAVTGFQGKYRITYTWNNILTDTTVYLGPGTDAFNVTVMTDTVGIRTVGRTPRGNRTTVYINNSPVSFAMPSTVREPLFVKAYSLSGKLLAQVPVAMHSGKCSLAPLPAGCYLYRIGTATRNYHTMVDMNFR